MEYLGPAMKKRPPPPPMPPPVRMLKHGVETEESKQATADWRAKNHPDRDGKPLDLIWPKNTREAEIIKQQNELNSYFHWHEALCGFAVATCLWPILMICFGGS